ncbi:ABC transporter permease [Alloacidobacterium sp.]|uniref:ABC transporter permease n=1 Tax=Alloacidobacterium sp. TaxID=2951999 RepID=UPI002D37C22C|nr:ABC transporter permease [Alloacidobacterium sp.]HYK38229.1 ABC transporter permease [Alloacidobacterium sp.]
MKLWIRVRSVLRNLFQKQHVEKQLDDEVRAYADMIADERVAAGMSASEARRTALADLGGAEQVKQAVRDRRAGAGMEILWQDARYGLRQLARNPGFTVTVVLTLALSIGANTAIFSIVNALMLKSLPYAHPERMGTIYTRIRGPIASDERHHVNGEQWELLRDHVPALISAVSGIRPSGVNLETRSHAQYVRAGRISEHYLDVLAIHPLLGRNFTKAEDLPHGTKTAILSYGLWHSTFGSNPNILGKAILLKGEPYTVIGVLPEGLTIPLSADVYTALQPSRDGEGAGTNFEAITRLRDGATWQEADAQINRAWSLRTNRYELEDNPGAQVSYYSVPLQKGETATLRPQALALMLAAGFILLIACANLAGLTLVQVLRRTPEIATRLALGASRWHIQKQLWIENLLLALLGGMVGVATGFLALRGLIALLPEHFLPVADVSLDGGVLAFTFLISLLTSVLFGMLPTLTTRRLDLRSAIGSRMTTGSDHLRLRQALIAGEVALTVVLLAAAGLLIRTLIHLQTLPPGFNPNGVMTATASLDDARYHDAAAFRKLLSESTAAMRQIPGVEQAAVGLSLPYERSLIMGGISISDGKEAGQKAMADEVYVTPDYFAALQIPVLAGRSFTDEDGPGTQRVTIVNREFARKFFHNANPVGRHIFEDMLIVGVVEDVAMAPGIDPIAPLTNESTMYVPATQMESSQISVVHVWFQPSWIVRTSGPVEGLTAQMQHALASVDPNLPFSGFYSMKDLLAKTLATQRVEVALLGAMAALALILSAVGIFALVANIVAQKTREIGIRMALGSTARQAMVHVGATGAWSAVVGLALGLVLCAGALRAMRSVLYGTSVYDSRTILAVVLMLATVTVIAAIAPTLRISRIDPAQTLREE